jgi:hypothetical protein
MKPKTLLSALLISGIFAIPSAALSRDETNHDARNEWYRWSENDARHLQGRWYLNGDPSKPTTITVNGRRLEATNENGNTSRLETDRSGNIRASDWRGLRGSLKGNRIQWDNGTTWTRMPSDRFANWSDRWSEREARQLQGRWYFNGDPKKPTEINVNGKSLEARNENGETSRLQMDRYGNVRAPDWQGIRGNVKGDRIEWENGTTWIRRSSERYSGR